MKIIVPNDTASDIDILNLGRIPADNTVVFPLTSFLTQRGVGGEKPEIFTQLEAHGLNYELALEPHDKGLVARKFITVTTEDLVAKGAHDSADFQNAYPFCEGARFLGGRIVITELVNNSDAGFAAGTCLIDVGLASAHDTFKANLDAEHGSGSTGSTALTSFAGADLSGETLYVDIANSAATALMNETTAGAFEVEVFYTVA